MERPMPEADQTNATPTFKSLERDGYHAQAATYGDRPGRLTRQAIAPMLQAVAAAPGMVAEARRGFPGVPGGRRRGTAIR